jgi:hypothetical protein
MTERCAVTQKKQWLLFGAILAGSVVGTWALVRYAGLGAPTPVGPPALNPAPPTPPQANRGNPESPPVNPVNTPPIEGQAVLPFGNTGGQTAGQASVPNFGSRGGAAGAGGGGGGASLPTFGAPPAGNNRGAAPVSGGASVPTFGDPPAGGNNRGGAAPAGGSGGTGGAGAGGAGGARLPFDINNAVAVATPTGNPASPTGGAVMPSFVTGGTPEPGRGGAGVAGGGTAGVPSGLIQGAALVPPFMIDQSDPNAIAKHYLKQLCADRVPTLADWQKLIDMKLPDADKWLHAPVGKGHFVMAMCLDKQNNLWVGEESGDNSGGLYRFSAADGLWQRFTTKDGLGDDNIYALACDSQGRIWAGHLNHGITVFNGQKFQSYEVVAGLSKPGTLAGPLGERIFRIAVAPDHWSLPAGQAPTFHDTLTDKDSPMAGSVWMATSAGIAIYFPSTDTWSYLTRAEGLPSDQANAIAFAKDGTVYVGLQCDAIALASPADHYATWQQVTAANPTPHPVDGKLVDTPVPTVGQGPGLPTDLINDLLVAQDGTVYAATTLGLAWSTDKGNSWQFIRGADWIDKVKNRFGGPPPGWQAPTDANKGGAILAEDYTTTLAEDPDGNLFVGHRATAGDILAPKAAKRLNATDNLCVTSLVPIPGTKIAIRGTYGDGMSIHSNDLKAPLRLLTSTAASAPAKPPSGALPPSTEQLEKLAAKAKGKLATNQAVLAYMGQDWMTQGDWVGRYGRQLGLLCAAHSPSDWIVTLNSEMSPRDFIRRGIDSRFSKDEYLRYWLEGLQSDDVRSLWVPCVGSRRQAIWDDHGEAYPTSHEGPNIWLTIPLPEGIYRVSLYFFPMRQHEHALGREYRDLVMDIGTVDPYIGPTVTLLEHARISLNNGGQYHQFLLEGGRTFQFAVRRQFSYNAMLNGVFIDRLSGPGKFKDSDKLAYMVDVNYSCPPLPNTNSLSTETASIITVLKELTALKSIHAGSSARRMGILMYRAASSRKEPDALLAYLRWSVPIWTQSDRAEWGNAVGKGWRRFAEFNPGWAARLGPKHEGPEE